MWYRLLLQWLAETSLSYIMIAVLYVALLLCLVNDFLRAVLTPPVCHIAPEELPVLLWLLDKIGTILFSLELRILCGYEANYASTRLIIMGLGVLIAVPHWVST